MYEAYILHYKEQFDELCYKETTVMDLHLVTFFKDMIWFFSENSITVSGLLVDSVVQHRAVLKGDSGTVLKATGNYSGQFLVPAL